MMKYKLWQYPRGANRGGVLNVDVCPTITESTHRNNTLLIEYEDQEDTPPTLLASDYKSPHLVIKYEEEQKIRTNDGKVLQG